jgi:centromere/kinetochore protein ZW10
VGNESRDTCFPVLTSSLQLEIHQINEDTKDDVASWVRNAKSLQEDIVRSKAIANDIIRQSEMPDVSGQTIRDAEARADFLAREVQYSQQLAEALRGIQHVNQLLSRAEQASVELRILDSLHLLEGTALASLCCWYKLTWRGLGRVLECHGRSAC